MLAAEMNVAIANLKRNEQWRLRNGGSLPEVLLPAHFMQKGELPDVFLEGDSSPNRMVVRKHIKRKDHEAAIVCSATAPSAKTTSNNLYQVYTGSPVHSTHVVLGKIGCIKLIREQISEELEFICSRPAKLSTESLAEYLSQHRADTTMRCLDQLNTGQMVSEVSVRTVCEKLLIDMHDIVFDVPSIYKNRKKATRYWRASLWAETWSEWIERFEWYKGLVGLDVPAYNIFFKIILDGEPEQYRKLAVALGPLHSSIVSFSKLPIHIAKGRLVRATDKFHELGFDCWTSYRQGLRTGEPDHRPKLFLTIARKDSIGSTVTIDGYMRYDASIDYTSLPKRLPYIR